MPYPESRGAGGPRLDARSRMGTPPSSGGHKLRPAAARLVKYAVEIGPAAPARSERNPRETGGVATSAHHSGNMAPARRAYRRRGRRTEPSIARGEKMNHHINNAAPTITAVTMMNPMVIASSPPSTLAANWGKWQRRRSDQNGPNVRTNGHRAVRKAAPPTLKGITDRGREGRREGRDRSGSQTGGRTMTKPRC